LRALVQTRLARSPVIAFTLVPESFAFPAPDRVHVVVLISVVLKFQHGGGRLSHHQYTDRTTLVLSLHGGAWRFLKGM
jgi:hypothetical protein